MKQIGGHELTNFFSRKYFLVQMTSEYETSETFHEAKVRTQSSDASVLDAEVEDSSSTRGEELDGLI